MHEMTRREAMWLAAAAGAVLVGGSVSAAAGAELGEEVKKAIAKSKAQLLFCGGHGGLVTYDGNGGPMVKDGGPVDRLFILKSEGSLFELGGRGLEVTYGSLHFRTGPLAGEVKVEKLEGADTLVYFRFKGNESEDAIEIIGGIPELGLPADTVLFAGTVELSEMLWVVGDVSKSSRFPYTGVHNKFFFHPAIANKLGLKVPVRGLVAVSGWDKGSGPKAIAFRETDKVGPAFRTQQHFGTLRVFLDWD
jgi:hypothetical protein